MNDWQDINFIDELSRENIIIEKFEVSFSISNAALFDKFKKKISEKNFDLFLSSCDDRTFFSELFQFLRQKSIPSVLFCCDNLSVPFVHKKFCSFFDLVWLTSHETEYLFSKWNASTIVLPYAANPYRYFPVNGKEIDGISFIGTLYGARLEKVKLISELGINFNLYGGNNKLAENSIPVKNFFKNFKHALFMSTNLAKFSIGRKTLTGALLKSMRSFTSFNYVMPKNIANRKSLRFNQISKIYSRSMISLGVSELWNTYLLENPVHKIHLRTFEIGMSGGLQIVSRNNELKNYFEEDKEIILYSDENEFKDKLLFYTNKDNKKIRDKIKFNARIRSEGEHNWLSRFKKIFEELNL